MQTMELPKLAVKRPKFKSFSTDEEECINLLKKRFEQAAPDIVLVSDITYIRIGLKFFHLCVIIDLFSRKVVAYKISAHPDAQLVKDTFMKAYLKRNPKGQRQSVYSVYIQKAVGQLQCGSILFTKRTSV